MNSTGRIRVAIFFGGVSSEHDVSCLTAGGVTRAIDRARFEVLGVGITPKGKFVQVSSDAMGAQEVVDGRLPRLTEDGAEAVLLRRDGGGRVATIDGDRLVDVHDFDVAFALLHGPFGEDGTIQGLFEMLGVHYVGSGVAGSAIGMDKILMKRMLQAAGIPVAPYIEVNPRQWREDPHAVLDAAAALALPLYVKPARGGSSMGISRVTTLEELPVAIDEAGKHDPKVLVEEGFVGAREIELAVLGNVDGAAPDVSLPGEIRMHTQDAFYDFEAKYLPGEQVSIDVPADLDDDEIAACQEMAARAFEALLAEGLSRVDLFVTRKGGVYVNEINTMPGFTRFSMFPMMWDASGISYPDVIARLVELALNRPLGLR